MSGEFMVVWVVGQKHLDGAGWDLQGIFTDMDRAILACVASNYFVGPLPLDTALPHEAFEWPGAFYWLFPPDPSPTIPPA